MREPTPGELEARRFNSVTFGDKPSDASSMMHPRITFYVTNATVTVGKNKLPSRETNACNSIASQLFTGQSSDYRIGVLAPFFDRVKVDVATIQDKTRLVPAGTITIEDVNGKMVSVLRGNPNPAMFVDGMIKALAASRIPFDANALNNSAACVKRICQLIDVADGQKKQLAAIQAQIKAAKNPSTVKNYQAQEVQQKAKVDQTEKELQATRDLLKQLQERKPAEAKEKGKDLAVR